MIDQQRASKLAGRGYDLWQAGQLEKAREKYAEAIPLADPQHYGLPGYHGEYACVLNQLGKHDAATDQLEKALEAELRQGELEGSAAILISRYFLADQLLRLGANERALAALGPSVHHAPKDWLTRFVEAKVLFALGRKTEANCSAALAIANSPTPEKASELRTGLIEVLGAPNSRSAS
jgi:tetratricopeptide (TPR) repeat protein